jgi:arginase family enzyme
MRTPLQVPYAGVHTFARAPFGALEGLRPGDVAVVGVPLSSTGLRPGTEDGPRLIRQASLDVVYPLQSAGTLVDIETKRSLTWPADLRLVDLGDLPLYREDLQRTLGSLRELIAAVAARQAMPVALGGDRAVTSPLVLGFASGVRERRNRAGFILISSDLTFEDEHPQWGKDWQGARLRRIVESGQIDPGTIAVAGVHGLQMAEPWDLVQKMGVTVLDLTTMRRQGMKATAEQALAIAGRGTGSVYLSLDINVVDAGEAPGQGEVRVGGLTARELLALVAELDRPQIGALDAVGVTPAYDPSGRAQELAARALIEVIAHRVFQ